jgi:integrase
MAGKQAKILSDDQVEWLLLFASTTRNPNRNRVLVLLSLKAGLRAGEIANLTWPMVLDPGGDIAAVIELRDHAAKKKSGRVIAMHPDLRGALVTLVQTSNQGRQLANKCVFVSQCSYP